MNEHLKQNIKSILNIDYPSYSLYLIVESKDDPAYSLINTLIEDQEKAYLVVAGHAMSCGQKNKNMLEAIKTSKETDDVYMFLDSDIQVNAEWVKNIILPLSDKSVTVSTGFRWLYPNKNTPGQILHASMNALQWCFMNFIPFNSIWGGSMAIRREDFEEFRIKEHWEKTVVDDMSLMQILISRRKKSILVPDCIAETNEVIENLVDAIKWCKRQIQLIKYHLRLLWVLALVQSTLISLNILSFPFFLAITFFSSHQTFFILSIYTGLSILVTMLWLAIIKKPGKRKQNRIMWFILIPFNIILGTWAAVLSLFTNVIYWNGICYHLDPKGIVKKITR